MLNLKILEVSRLVNMDFKILLIWKPESQVKLFGCWAISFGFPVGQSLPRLFGGNDLALIENSGFGNP